MIYDLVSFLIIGRFIQIFLLLVFLICLITILICREI